MRRWLFLPALLALTALACNTFFPPRPAVEWDPDPQTVVIELYTAGGLVPQYFLDNYIPAARVWGDGRIIWVEDQAGGGRRVLAGQLTPDAMRALLQQIVDAGFFGWQDTYEPPYQVYDAGSTVFSVHLRATSKTVSEYFQGAPEKFHELAGVMASGAGAAGAEFTPARGYLRAHPQTTGEAASDWPDAAAGFTLAEAQAGRWVEGAALHAAWAAVNQNPWNTPVRSAGQVYQLTLQVPGVSFLEPPGN